MDDSEIASRLNGLVEELAAVEHDRWAHWQRYMHGQAERLPDGSLKIPVELVSRWEKQIAQRYADLTEKEKDSDREQVMRYLPIILRGMTLIEQD